MDTRETTQTSGRVLVAYATKHHSTEEIAERIGETLRESGLDIDVRTAEEVGHLDEYRAVVLGSAVYMGRWCPEARAFLKRHGDVLAERDLWLFSSGPVGRDDAPEQWVTPRGPDRAGTKLHAHDHVVFGGRVPPDPSGTFERAVVDRMSAGTRDMRDWGVIREWAAGIAGALAARPAAGRR